MRTIINKIKTFINIFNVSNYINRLIDNRVTNVINCINDEVGNLDTKVDDNESKIDDLKYRIEEVEQFDDYKLSRKISRYKKELQYNIDINSNKIITINNEIRDIKLLDFQGIADRLNDMEDKIKQVKGLYFPNIADRLKDIEDKIILANKKIHKHINNNDNDNDIILGSEKSRYINVNMCAVDIAKYRTYEDGGDINAEDIKAIEDIIFKHINLTNEGDKNE